MSMKKKTINITMPIHYNDNRNCYAAFLLGIKSLIDLDQKHLKTLLDDPNKHEVNIRIRPIETNEG